MRDDQKIAFCDYLKKTCNVSRAAELAGVSNTSVYAARKSDPDFAAAWEEALDYGVDMLELEAQRRAFHGTLKPVFYKGDIVGQITEYSDPLAMFLLKAHRPEKYRERSEVKTENTTRLVLTPEQRVARLASILEQAKRRKASGNEVPLDDLA